MEIPNVGSTITIQSIKHDGTFHRSWEENTILYRDAVHIVGYNQYTLVHEAKKEPWRTKEPVIFYFDKRYWFNIIFLIKDQPSYYCNLSSPFTYRDGLLQYIDYDLDVLVQPNGIFEVVDQQEYEQNCQYFSYPLDVQQQISSNLERLIDWITTQQGPFRQECLQYYDDLYKEKNNEH